MSFEYVDVRYVIFVAVGRRNQVHQTLRGLCETYRHATAPQ